MQKTTSFKNSRKLSLVASLWSAPSDAIIIMAHGSGANRFGRGMLEKVAQGLNKDNYNVLSFDFAGHGSSDDDVFNAQKSFDDLAAAVLFVKEQGYKRFAFFGHSLGAYACLKQYSPEIETMVLVGALTGPVNWNLEDFISPEQFIEAQKNGYVVSEINDGLRTSIKTDVKIFDEVRAIDQQKLLSNVLCPLLIIHGDDDQQELDLLAASKKGIPFLPQNSELIEIFGASHTFVGHEEKVIIYTREWYAKYFPVI